MRVLIAVALLMMCTALAQRIEPAPKQEKAQPAPDYEQRWIDGKCFSVPKDLWLGGANPILPCSGEAKQEKAQPANLQSTGTGTLTVFNPQPGNFTLFGLNGKVLVTIHLDGTIEYGKDYTPDKAAKVFWEALGRDMPCKELRKR